MPIEVGVSDYISSSYKKIIGMSFMFIYLFSNQITDLSSLKNLIHLNLLSLSHNNILSLDSIKYLQKIHSLDISCNKITDFS